MRVPRLLVWSVAAATLLLLFLMARMRDEVSAAFNPKDGELVAIRSVSTGKYLEVSRDDGMLYASASAPTNSAALFRVMLLTKPVVNILVDAMRTANTAAWAERRMITESGCECSGYSNAHGLGAYCYGWEYAEQAPWCYVPDTCTTKSGGGGSFGRKFDDCLTMSSELGNNDPRTQEAFENMEMEQKAAAEVMQEPGEGDSADDWQTASGCPCSGYSNSLGYGPKCGRWEYEGQTPWCYVSPNCKAAAEVGSFGQPYDACVRKAPSDMQPSPALDAQAGSAARLGSMRRLRQVRGEKREKGAKARLARIGVTSQAYSDKQQWVVLRSVATNTFLSVEPQPHPQAKKKKTPPLPPSPPPFSPLLPPSPPFSPLLPPSPPPFKVIGICMLLSPKGGGAEAERDARPPPPPPLPLTGDARTRKGRLHLAQVNLWLPTRRVPLGSCDRLTPQY